MGSRDQDRLLRLLRALREPAPSQEARQQALEAFERELGRKRPPEADRSQPGPERRRS